jgi:hypothetical protein
MLLIYTPLLEGCITASDRIKEISAEMSRLLEQQKKILGSSTKLPEMDGVVIDEYFLKDMSA